MWPVSLIGENNINILKQSVISQKKTVPLSWKIVALEIITLHALSVLSPSEETISKLLLEPLLRKNSPLRGGHKLTGDE